MAETVSEAGANREAVETEAVASAVAVTVLPVAIVRHLRMSGAESF